MKKLSDIAATKDWMTARDYLFGKPPKQHSIKDLEILKDVFWAANAGYKNSEYIQAIDVELQARYSQRDLIASGLLSLAALIVAMVSLILQYKSAN